jgi:hypothetical protein
VYNRAVRLLWIFGGYTVLGLFLAAANSLTYLSTGNSANWILSIKRSLAEWYVWAALTPVILHLAARWPLERSRLLSSTTIHLGAMLVVGIFKLLVDQYVRKWMFGRAGYLLLSTLAFNLLIYCIIVAAAHGLRYYRSGRERELRASQLEAPACRNTAAASQHAASAPLSVQHAQRGRRAGSRGARYCRPDDLEAERTAPRDPDYRHVVGSDRFAP